MERLLKPIFIGGTGRSGTTIMRKSIAAHSKVFAMPQELRIIVDPGGGIDLANAISTNWSPYTADNGIHRFERILREASRNSTEAFNLLQRMEGKLFTLLGISPRRYLGMRLGIEFGKKNIREQYRILHQKLVRHSSFSAWVGSLPFQRPSKIYETSPLDENKAFQIVGDFFNGIYEEACSRFGFTHWVDDTPENMLKMPDLIKMFPRSQYIVIYRDPRDVLASYLTKKWGGDDIFGTVNRLSGIYKKWFHIRKLLPEDRFLELSLEKIADRPRQFLEEICHFIGVLYEDSLEQIKLDRVHSGRWRTEIPYIYQEDINKMLQPAITEYGYA